MIQAKITAGHILVVHFGRFVCVARQIVGRDRDNENLSVFRSTLVTVQQRYMSSSNLHFIVSFHRQILANRLVTSLSSMSVDVRYQLSDSSARQL